MTRASVKRRRPRPYRLATCLRVFLYGRRRRSAALVRDLSPTGAYIGGKLPLRPSQKLEVEVELGGQGFLLPAEVARIDRGGAGIRFGKLARDAELALVHYVASGREAAEAASFAAAAGPAPSLRRRERSPDPPPARRRWPWFVELAIAFLAAFAAALAARVFLPGTLP
jgi:hypothetical protein